MKCNTKTMKSNACLKLHKGDIKMQSVQDKEQEKDAKVSRASNIFDIELARHNELLEVPSRNRNL